MRTLARFVFAPVLFSALVITGCVTTTTGGFQKQEGPLTPPIVLKPSKPAPGGHPCSELSDMDCHNLGIKYSEQGEHKKAQNVFAFNCLKKDAAPSCVNAGVEAYDLGDLKSAHTLYERACSKDIGLGCVNLGCFDNPYASCKKLGKPVIATAEKLYAKACDLKERLGCLSLGKINEAQKHTAKAMAAYRKGCDLGDPAACQLSGK